MARKLRIQYPGAIYHVMNRGDHQELIFSDDDDRSLFVSTLAEGCQKTGRQIHSFCLMSNHFHLVIETPNANLVAGMKWLLGEWGIPWDRPGAGGQFAAVIETRRQAERDQEFKPLVRGWCVGAEQFRSEMLQYIEEQRGKWHYGAELSESGEAKAERLIAESLRTAGVTEEQIVTWRKGHPFKVRLAARLRAETTVTISWIAHRLAMGTRGHLAHLLYRNEQARVDPPPGNQPGLNI
jgi:REP element-mobilizing transposase RayT